MAFRLFSPEFNDGGPIPRKFTCDGSDIPPTLKWEEPPAGTMSFALILNDPDAPAGDWVHWVVYNIPAEQRELSAGAPVEISLPAGAQQGRNSWRQVRYGGPCPPSGTHRYFFTLYALDCILKLDGGADRQELLRAMQEHILAKAQLMGTYTRNK